MLGMGTDTVPAMLTPGEFVMSRGAVSMFGADTMMAMNKAGGGTNEPKMANNIQMAAGGGMVGSTLDPTKTAASMPHVFQAAQQARARARAAGLPPEEVERRVIEASERAKAAGPPKVSGAFGSPLSMDGPPTPDNPNYSTTTSSSALPPAKDYKVSAPIVANAGTQSSPSPAKSIPTTGSMPSSPFKCSTAFK